jgi:hypothetical protein
MEFRLQLRPIAELVSREVTLRARSGSQDLQRSDLGVRSARTRKGNTIERAVEAICEPAELNRANGICGSSAAGWSFQHTSGSKARELIAPRQNS